MSKANLMFGVLGLGVGLSLGFVFANSANRPGSDKVSAVSTPPANNSTQPGQTSPGSAPGDQADGSALPQVTAAIERARAKPGDFEAQMTAADLYYQTSRFDDAAKLYEAANKLRPADPEPIIKAGNSCFDAEKYEQAEKWYLLALEKEPKNINVRSDLGLTFFLRSPRDIGRAIREYKAALAIDADHAVTLQNLVLAYSENGDKNALRSTIEKLKRIDPNNPAVLKIEEK